MKTKKSSDKMLPPVRIEPGTSDSKSNTVLSELTWHVQSSLGLTFCYWKYCFHLVKPLMPILPVLPISSSL